MPVDHYENFPVASLLLPRRLRRPIEAIYRFARAADDIADEGDASAASPSAGSGRVPETNSTGSSAVRARPPARLSGNWR
jgi:phytoene/squalene synthetase